MKSSYSSSDVILLLKDITGCIEPLPTKEREALIQTGTHYSEMLPLEYKPSPQYMEAYEFALSAYSIETAHAVCRTAEKIYQNSREEIVLVSLARAGVAIGILIKHYLEHKYSKKVCHYGISIIRGLGIDQNAMQYILQHHQPETLQFVDGWIGKGAIQRELTAALDDYPGVSSQLAVLSDPANITPLCGTHDDILIASSCLNSTVSGLISRTVYRPDLIGPKDFHGAVYYQELSSEDRSYEFIERTEAQFDYNLPSKDTTPCGITGLEEVMSIARHYSIPNINFVKPGIGEATRVLLRRVPWKLLLRPDYQNDPLLSHLVQLAKEKQVPIEVYDLHNYKACGIIKNMADA